MDKWLWAARFFKTRALAARACELGRIESNGQPAKPAREVHLGDRLQVKNDSGDFQLEVLALSEMRGPAAVAQTLYRETEASRELRLTFQWFFPAARWKFLSAQAMKYFQLGPSVCPPSCWRQASCPSSSPTSTGGIFSV